MKLVGVAVRLTQNLSWGPQKGQYYAGIDNGSYGSGYPIYRDLIFVMTDKAAKNLIKASPNDPVEIVLVYVNED